MVKTFYPIQTSFSILGYFSQSTTFDYNSEKRGPQRKLSLEQIVALNIYRFHFKNGDLKNYHKMIKELMSDKVPNLPNYENFMKTTNKSTVFIAFMKFLMEINRAILKTSFSVMQILLTVKLQKNLQKL